MDENKFGFVLLYCVVIISLSLSSSFTFFDVFDRNDFDCDNDGGTDAVSFDPVGGGEVTVVLV